MSNIILSGPEKWGPLAWHLLHAFTISNKKISEKNKDKYYIFFECFADVIPCKICSTHYNDFLNYIIPLEKNKITRKYIKRWVFDIHNLINEYLNKKIFSYKNCILLHSNIDNKNILFFINTVYLNFDYNKMSIFKFDKILQFYINFCYLYPDKIIKKTLLKKIKTNEFINIKTPIEFKLWYQKNYIFN
jgi:hypothetical protein